MCISERALAAVQTDGGLEGLRGSVRGLLHLVAWKHETSFFNDTVREPSP